MRFPESKTGSVQSDSESIYYEDVGAPDADVVVLTHGAGGHHAIWYQQVPVLAERYRVVTWDQRSFGRSTDRQDAAGPEAFARDLSVLLDHLEIEKAHLVGQSMGGWTVARFCLDHPQRVNSLVLADTLGGFLTPEAREDVDRLRQGTGLRSDALPISHHPAVGKTTSERDPLRGFLYRQLGGVAGDLNPKIGGRLFRDDLSPRADEIEVPVLCVVGSEDELFRPPAIRSIAALFADARVVEIEEAGHSPYFERPEVWNDAVLSFLRDVEEG